MALGLSISIAAAAVISWFQAGKLSAPFRKYTEKAHSIASGKYDLEWPQARTKEIQQLGKSLQYMAEEISKREKALIENENRMQDLVTNVPGVVYQYSVDTDELDCIIKEKAMDVLGLNSGPERFLNDLIACLPQEDLSRFHESAQKSINNVEPWLYMGKFKKPSGEEIWIECRSVPRKVGDSIIFYGLIMDTTRRRQMEEDLYLAGAIFNSASIGIHQTTPEGKILNINPYAAEMLGYTVEELSQLAIRDIDGLLDDAAIARGWERYTSNQIQNFETVHIKKDGTRIPVEIRSTPLEYEGRKFSIDFIQDITERKKAEESLRLTQFIFDKAPIGIWRMGDSGEVLDVNEQACVSVGYTHEELKTMKVFDFAPGFNLEHWEKGTETLNKTGTITTEVYHKHKNGKIFPIQVIENQIRFEDQVFRIAFVLDISERRQMEQALRDSQERLDLALSSANEGIWDWHIQEDKAYLDSRFYTMAGYEPHDFPESTKEWIKRIHKDDIRMVMSEASRYLSGETEKFDIELRFLCKDGSYIWVQSRGKIVSRDKKGNPVRFIGTHTDITERKQMAEALEKRIIALTQPLEDAESITFEDLFNLSDIQRLQDLYAEAFGVAALITHPDGTPITEPSNFTTLCGEIIRKTPEGIKNCNYSDAMVGKHNPDGPNIQPCLSAGLCNAGTSITVGGRHIANWLIGQVRNEAQKEEEILPYAREIGADVEAFRDAYRQVPTMSEEQFEKAAHVLFDVTRQLSISAYQNIQQARFITQRKEAEHALKENEQLLVNILESMNEGVIMLDRDFNYKLFNNFMENLSDTPKKNVLGKKPWEVFPYIKETDIEDKMKKAMNGEKIIGEETHLNFPGSRDTWLKDSFIPLKNTDGHIIGTLIVAIDITRQKQDEEELRRLQNYLSNIIDSMPSILVAVDSDGNVTQWNSQTQKATGLSFEDVRAQPLAEVFPLLADEMNNIRDSIRERRVIRNTKIRRKENKDVRFKDVTIFPLTANCIEGAVIRVDDITEQVRLEEMMIQSEKMLSIGGLAAGMAHEINNPLAGIMQTAKVISNRLTDKLDIPANRKAAKEAGTNIEAVRRFMEARNIPGMLSAVMDSGYRVAAIVNNMLSFARKSEATVSSHNLDILLDKTAELAATDYDLKKQYDFKRIKIKKDYAENLPEIPCEDAKIQQVLLNILRNGAQAMQAAGTESPQFIFRIWFDRLKDMAVIEIEDNGPGMDEETRKRVFEPFFTTKPVGIGTGLGLSVSYFIIAENHRGEMEVISRPGAGANFIIRLPAGSAK